MPPRQKSRRAGSLVEKDGTRTIPIVFISPSLQPDVRLTVLDQEFHVHSVLLKLHSNFFRKFLDAPGRPVPSPSAHFQHEYVSVVDEDGEWGLEPAGLVKEASPASRLPDLNLAFEPEWEVEAFRKLLCAMYNRPYTIKNFDELHIITRVADFYCALPVVSATLTGALLGSPIFKCWDDPACNRPKWKVAAPNLLPLAKKLRHSVLFRECFIRVVSDWYSESPKVKNQRNNPIRDDPVLHHLVCQEYIETSYKLLKVSQAVVEELLHGKHCENQLRSLHNSQRIPGFAYDSEPLRSASHFRQLLNKLRGSGGKYRESALVLSLEDLLQNNLVLDQSGYGPGEGDYEHNYFCANITDEDMPWDPTEVDW